MNIWLSTAFCILATAMALPYDATASADCANHVDEASGLNIDQLLRNASFVGLYKAQTATKLDTTVANSSSHLYNYELIRIKSLVNTGQNTISLVGIRPYDQVPQQYFAILDLHKLATAESPAGYGMTVPVARSSDEVCFFAPRFLLGYTYLIVGGVDSSMSYEMVPITELDHWYRLVEGASKKL